MKSWEISVSAGITPSRSVKHTITANMSSCESWVGVISPQSQVPVHFRRRDDDPLSRPDRARLGRWIFESASATRGPMPGTRECPLAGPTKRLILTCDGTWLDVDDGIMNGRKHLSSNVSGPREPADVVVLVGIKPSARVLLGEQLYSSRTTPEVSTMSPETHTRPPPRASNQGRSLPQPTRAEQIPRSPSNWFGTVLGTKEHSLKLPLF